MAKTVIINGVTYPGVPEVQIPLAVGGSEATFYETSEDDVSAADVKSGKKAHGASGQIIGSMSDNGQYAGTMTVKAGLDLPAGAYDSGSHVDLDAASKAALVSDNLKAGTTILGISGKATVVDTEDANATANQILNGATAYVGGSKVTGAATVPTVSQDATTKVVTIE